MVRQLNPTFTLCNKVVVQFFSAALFFAVSISSDASTVTINANKLIPVESFFKNSEFSQASLSPDGKWVAMLAADSRDRLMLAIMDVTTNTPKILARYSEVDVGQFYWVNNKRLVYSLMDRKTAPGDTYSGSGLFAVDVDGGNQRQLIERQFSSERKTQRILSPRHAFHDVIREKDTDDIYVTEYIDSGSKRRGTVNLLRLNTRTGQTTTIQRPGDVEQWIVDQDGVPRAVVTFEEGKNVSYIKRADKWVKLFDSDAMDEEGVKPEFFAPDGTFYVTALFNHDTRALYSYDLDKNKMSPEPVVSLKGYDYNGNPVFDKKTNKLLGVHFETDAPGTLWLDERYKAIQQKIDALIPGKINRISVRTDGDSDTVLVISFSDVDPGVTLLFNTKTEQTKVLGLSRPWIKPEQMAYQDFVKYKARDGLEIPAYLTLPQGKNKNLPLVVLVHGGPYVRGEHWGWNPEAQFLASRGYAVLQPEFRGSTGYGLKHHKAGWKQWGLSMQDDVTDGTRWLISQGIADPQRICIAGASYGGYATLWGLIKEHDLYQCGISWVGVSDINLLYSVAWSDANDDTTRYFLPKKVGDQEKDAAQLKATSPLENASKLTRPLILAYGGADRRVPAVHGTKLLKAVKEHNSKVEWIEYPEEGHGWSQLKNNVDFWTRVEKFLGENIGQ